MTDCAVLSSVREGEEGGGQRKRATLSNVEQGCMAMKTKLSWMSNQAVNPIIYIKVEELSTEKKTSACEPM